MTRYHPALVALHWLGALLILFSLAMGTLSLETMSNSSPDKLFALRVHMVVGFAIFVLMLARLAVRLTTQRPPPVDTGNAFIDRLASVAHAGLYVLVLLMAASGLALAVQAGLPGILFGAGGSLPESFSAFPPRAVHGLLAKLLVALIGLHVLAALYHQFIRRDGLLRRMAFGRR